MASVMNQQLEIRNRRSQIILVMSNSQFNNMKGVAATVITLFLVLIALFLISYHNDLTETNEVGVYIIKRRLTVAEREPEELPGDAPEKVNAIETEKPPNFTQASSTPPLSTLFRKSLGNLTSKWIFSNLGTTSVSKSNETYSVIYIKSTNDPEEKVPPSLVNHPGETRTNEPPKTHEPSQIPPNWLRIPLVKKIYNVTNNFFASDSARITVTGLPRSQGVQSYIKPFLNDKLREEKNEPHSEEVEKHTGHDDQTQFPTERDFKTKPTLKVEPTRQTTNKKTDVSDHISVDASVPEISRYGDVSDPRPLPIIFKLSIPSSDSASTDIDEMKSSELPPGVNGLRTGWAVYSSTSDENTKYFSPFEKAFSKFFSSKFDLPTPHWPTYRGI